MDTGKLKYFILIGVLTFVLIGGSIAGYVSGMVMWGKSIGEDNPVLDLEAIDAYGEKYPHCDRQDYSFVTFMDFSCSNHCRQYCGKIKNGYGNVVDYEPKSDLARSSYQCIYIKIYDPLNDTFRQIAFDQCYLDIHWKDLEKPGDPADNNAYLGVNAGIGMLFTVLMLVGIFFVPMCLYYYMVPKRMPVRFTLAERQIKGESQCTMCQQIIDDGDSVYDFPCSHVFHKTCVMKWIQEHNTCPNCKRLVVPTDDISMYILE